jgi:hypothetical protein
MDMARPRPLTQNGITLDLSAYPALDFTGITRRANYRQISYTEDMLHVFDKKEAAAIVYHILFRWSEHRREEIVADIEHRYTHNLSPFTSIEVEERLWIYMSYNQFVRESGGALGYNTVIRMLEYLMKKKAIERRKNPNPRYSEYEYRINAEEVQALLKTLPAFPRYTPKGAKGKGNSDEEPTQMGTDTPQMGTGEPVDDVSSLGTPPTQPGLSTTQLGTADYPGGDTPQNPPQDSSQQQQNPPLDSKSNTETPATAALFSFDLQSLTPDEMALIQTYRQQHQHDEQAGTQEPAPAKADAEEVVPTAQHRDEPVQEVASPNSSDAPVTAGHPEPERDSTDGINHLPVRQAEIELPATARPGNAEEVVPGMVADNRRSIAPPLEQTLSTRVCEGNPPLPLRQQASPPDVEPALTPEAIVALFERKRGLLYDAVTRPRQLAAARTLINLGLPLDLVKLERVYDRYHDDWWVAHYGTLDVTHLVEREKSGEIRIVRWLTRMDSPSRTHRTRAMVTPTPEQRAGLRPMIGVSGFPIFQPSKTPLTVLPPPPPARRPGMSMAVAGRGV